MEIGLTAKVSPEVDERESEKQAGKLEGYMQNAVEGLEAAVEMADVTDRVSDMKDHVDGLSEHTQNASDNFTKMEESLDNFDTSVLEDLSEQDVGMDILFGDGPAMMGGQGGAGGAGGAGGDAQVSGGGGGGGTLAGVAALNEMKDSLGGIGSTLREQKTFMAKRLAQANSIRGILGGVGRGLTDTGGKVVLVGLGLILLSRIAGKLAEASPLLGAVSSMFSQALGLFFRPFGNIIGQMLLPIAAGMLRLAANFNRVFGNQGFWAAIVWLGDYIVSGLARGTMNFLGGSDNEFGIADAFRTALHGVGLFTIFKTGLLSKFPKVTAARILNFILPGPAVGTMLSKALKSKFGIEALEKSITTLIRGGLSRLVQRFVPKGVRTFATKIASALNPKNLFALIKSRLPSIGGGGIVKAIMGALPKLGVKAFLTRLLPSVGIKAILSKFGLAAVVKLLSGRLTYLIPVVGQVIGIIDLLVFVITALIPGMEAFSPVTWALVQVFNILKFIVFGIIDAFKGLWDWLTGLSLEGLLPDVSGSAIVDGLFAFAGITLTTLFPFAGLGIGALLSGGGGGFSLGGITEMIDNVVSTLRNYVGPILEAFKLPLMMLFPFAVLGIELYNMLMGVSWQDITNFLNDIKESVSNLGGAALEGAIDLAEWVGSGIGSLGNWVGDGLGDLSEWVGSGIGSLSNWVASGIGSLSDWVASGVGQIWDYVSNTSRSIWEFVTNSSREIWDFVTDVSRDIWNFVTNASRAIWDFVTGTTMAIWDFVTDVSMAIWDFVTDTSMAIWDFVTNASMSIWEFVSNTTASIWEFVSNTSKSIWDFVTDVSNSIWDFVTTPNIDLIDHIDIPNIDLGDYIDIPDIDLGDYIDRPSWLGGSARGRVARSPGVTAVAEKEPEVIVPYSKLDTFVNRMAQGATPQAALTNGERGDLPALAEGGIVQSATTALIGEGSESEAVLPLSRLSSMLSSPSSPDMSGGSSTEINVSADGSTSFSGDTDSIDEDTIASAVAQALSGELSSVESALNDVISEIRNLDTDQPIKVTADGKVLAEVNESGKDKYQRSRDITK